MIPSTDTNNPLVNQNTHASGTALPVIYLSCRAQLGELFLTLFVPRRKKIYGGCLIQELSNVKLTCDQYLAAFLRMQER